MSFALGWYYGNPRPKFEPPDDLGNSANFSPSNSGAPGEIDTSLADFYAGVADVTTETVVWSTEWVPVVADPAPFINYPLGENAGPIRIHTGPDDDNYTLFIGTLNLTATVDGVPLDGHLRIVMAEGGSYGNFAWDFVSGTGGGSGSPCLPELLAPAGTPVFLENGHAQQLRSVYRDVAMGTGHMRRIRTRTIAPRTVAVSWFVDANKVQAIEAWHEGSLRVGVEPFAARIARIGGRGLTWWRATWVGPLVYTPLNSKHWRVNGDLFLSCGGGLEGPVSTSARVEFEVALRATASAVITAYAAVEFVAELKQQFVGPTLRGTSSGELRTTTSGETRITR